MSKQWLKDMFGTDKVAVGLVHLKALPSDPLYDAEGGMDAVYEAALADLEALKAGDIDGILFSNEFSFPYQRHVDRTIIAAMATIIGRLRDKIDRPFGANVISDPMGSLELCCAVGGSFTRGSFSGAHVSNIGIVNNDPGEILRRRHNLGIDNLKMIHYANHEGGGSLGGLDPMEEVRNVVFSDLPDGLGVAGASAGSKADMSLLERVRAENPDMVLFATTGVKEETIEETYALADGAFIASSLKVDRVFENPIDAARVKSFMDKLKAFRNA